MFRLCDWEGIMNEHSTKAAATPVTDALAMGADETGTNLFAINLCASMTPMPSVPKHLKGFERYKLYQVSKMEDGRRRYRLRLGFFTSETDAELVVGSIRSLYPAAFTSCLSDEDLRYTGGLAVRPKPVKAVETPKPVAEPAPLVTAKPVVNAPARIQNISAPSPSPATAPTVTKAPVTASAVAAAPKTIRMDQGGETKKPAPEPELSLEIDLRGTAKSAAIPTEPAPKADVVPFHVARGIKVPDIALELAPEARPATKSKDVPTVQQKAAPSPAPKPTPPSAKPAAPAKPAPALREPLPPPPRIVEDYIPVLDTTLTLRTLTQAEIDDPNQPKWYVVQLAQSDHPVNLEAMPKLDIFSAYSLYSVAITTGGTIRHALRLGFFREEVSAEAVLGYLKTFFASPSVARVSSAEYMRFAEPPRKPETAGATADKVVQLKRTAPQAAPAPVKPAKPAVPAAAKNPTSPYAKIAKTASAAKSAAKGRTPARSLAEQLKEEARQTLLSESGIRKAPKPQSFLSRLIGRSLD